MQQKIHVGDNKAGQVVLKKVLSACLLLLLSMLLIMLVFAVAGQVLDIFSMHPPKISECLNGGGTWFYELNGCSD